MGILDKTIAAAFMAGMALCLGAVGFSLFHATSGAMTWQKALVGYLLPGGSALLLLLFLRRGAATRRLVALYGACAIVAIYASQAYLLYGPRSGEDRAADIARKWGFPIDNRNKRDVIADLKAAGKDSWPAVVTAKFLSSSLDFKGSELLPLSGISNVTSVNCNEFGSWMVYDADEHGFNNPQGMWSRPIELLAVGDSFVHGACEPPGRDLVSVLRESYPATINIGIGGRGPLMEMATFAEYAPTLRPPLTLWFFYDGNDLANLADERNRPMLMRYLREDFSQNLIGRQGDIDGALKEMISLAASSDFRKSAKTKIVDFALLRPLRERLGLNATGTVESLKTKADYLAMLPLFVETMTKARRIAEVWQGKILFVYLPSMEMFVDPKHIDTRQEVLAAARQSGLMVLDLTADFEKAENQAQRFWYGPGTHYSAEGYRFVGNLVAAYLVSSGHQEKSNATSAR